MNSELGLKYREEVLAPGGMRDSLDSVKMFMGRDLNDEAFMNQMKFYEK